jgi:hypothetical protein
MTYRSAEALRHPKFSTRLCAQPVKDLYPVSLSSRDVITSTPVMLP